MSKTKIPIDLDVVNNLLECVSLLHNTLARRGHEEATEEDSKDLSRVSDLLKDSNELFRKNVYEFNKSAKEWNLNNN